MSAADLQTIIDQIGMLSPQERAQLQNLLAADAPAAMQKPLSRRLRELGLVRHGPRQRSGKPRPPLVPITGKPVSQTLIEERR